MAENNEKLGIHLLIGNETHFLTIPRKKEKYFRDAADLINDLYNKYRQSYQNQTTAKYDAVVMLDIAVRYLQSLEKNDTKPIMDSIAEMQSEVEEALHINSSKPDDKGTKSQG